MPELLKYGLLALSFASATIAVVLVILTARNLRKMYKLRAACRALEPEHQKSRS